MVDRRPDAWFATDAVITIHRKGESAGSVVTTDVGNFEDSGGTKDVEQKAYYGGAFLAITQPQEQFEVSFDVKVRSVDWDRLFSDRYATSGSARYVISGGDSSDYKIKVEWLGASTTTPTGSTLGSDFGAGYKVIYYNARGVEFTRSGPADEELQGTLSFKLSPSSTLGSGQKYVVECDNFNNAAGSTLYYDLEKGTSSGSGDTLFGYT